MWDWSNQPQPKKNSNNSSLSGIYDDITKTNHKALPYSYQDSLSKPENFTIEEMHSHVELLLEKYKLPNMQLILKDYAPQSWIEMDNAFSEYQKARVGFIKLIAYKNIDELEKFGLKDSDIKCLKEGLVPENYNTHIKIPFDFGGELSFDNFSFIRTHHTHSNIHRVLDFQISKGFLLKYKKIFIPYFNGRFYYD